MSPAFASYIRPAQHHPQLWRLLLGILISMLVYLGWAVGLAYAFWVLSGTPLFWAWAESKLDFEAPGGVLIVFVTFVGMALGPMIVVRLLHRRGVRTLFGRASVVIRDFTIAALIVGAVYAFSTAVWSLSFDAVPNLDASLWLQLLPLSLAGVLLQTGSEELLFRGYLQQQLAARFRNPLIWMLLPSLIFGAVHYDPEMAGNSVWLVMVFTAVFGLAAADLTAVTGSLGAAWGFHFANNVVALLILSMPDTLTGLALFTMPYTMDDLLGLPMFLLLDLGVLGLTWLAIRRAVRR